MTSPALSDWITQQAARLGFDLCGVVEARAFPELARAEEWLARGYGGEMSYLADPRRAHPAAVLAGVRSVIVCALNYNTAFPRSVAAGERSAAASRFQPTQVSEVAAGGRSSTASRFQPTQVSEVAAGERSSTASRFQPTQVSEVAAGGRSTAASRFQQTERAEVAQSTTAAQFHQTERPEGRQTEEQGGPRGWISRYAWGDDYHLVLKEKLDALLGELRKHCAETFDARVYTDTGPLHERALAKYAGLGWIGKNTLLLNQRLGSYFFLGTILTTLELTPTLGVASAPPADLCGTCRRCIEACPTDALIEPYVMDARRCISYLTIELRGRIPQELRPLMGNHVLGCDICQDVCPWNNRAPITARGEFQPRRFPATGAAALTNAQQATGGFVVGEAPGQMAPEALPHSLYLPELQWLAGLRVEEFRTLFRGSPVKRTKWRGLVRNACIALGNAGLRPGATDYEPIVALLRRLAESSEEIVAESAQWALSRIQGWESGFAQDS